MHQLRFQLQTLLVRDGQHFHRQLHLLLFLQHHKPLICKTFALNSINLVLRIYRHLRTEKTYENASKRKLNAIAQSDCLSAGKTTLQPAMQLPSSMLQISTTSQAMNSTVNATTSNVFDVVLFIGRGTTNVNNSCFSARIFLNLIILMTL